MKSIANINKNNQDKNKDYLLVLILKNKKQRIKADLITKLKDNMDIYFNFCPIFGLTNMGSIIAKKIMVIGNLLIKLKRGNNIGTEQFIDLSILKNKTTIIQSKWY